LVTKNGSVTNGTCLGLCEHIFTCASVQQHPLGILAIAIP